MDILELALYNQQTAWKILEHTGIIPAWERIGATVHLVGSLKSGLLAKSRDIDLHIYTDTLDIAASFSVMQELAERLSLKEIHYNNLIQTEEECIEFYLKDGLLDFRGKSVRNGSSCSFNHTIVF